MPRNREQDLLLHADVFEEAGSKLSEGVQGDVTRFRGRLAQQGVQPAMVGGEEQ